MVYMFVGVRSRAAGFIESLKHHEELRVKNLTMEQGRKSHTVYNLLVDRSLLAP